MLRKRYPFSLFSCLILKVKIIRVIQIFIHRQKSWVKYKICVETIPLNDRKVTARQNYSARIVKKIFINGGKVNKAPSINGHL
jgi:hypothetical protein